MRLCEVPTCGRPSTGGRWCATHYARFRLKGDVLADVPIRKRNATVDELFWPRVNKDAEGGCWEWTGRITAKGYGAVTIKMVSIITHRYAYERLVGPIPAGLTIDHLCRNKKCCNPDHLEPVTSGENKRRASRLQTHCIAGHPLSGDNLYPNSKVRSCIACARRRSRDQLKKKRGAA